MDLGGQEENDVERIEKYCCKAGEGLCTPGQALSDLIIYRYYIVVDFISSGAESIPAFEKCYTLVHAPTAGHMRSGDLPSRERRALEPGVFRLIKCQTLFNPTSMLLQTLSHTLLQGSTKPAFFYAMTDPSWLPNTDVVLYPSPPTPHLYRHYCPPFLLSSFSFGFKPRHAWPQDT